MPADISEVFTHAVREVAPQAARKGIAFTFDYRGPRTQPRCSPQAMKAGLKRLFEGVIDMLEAGVVSFDAEARCDPRGGCVVHVKAGGAGKLAAVARQGEWLARWMLHEARHEGRQATRCSDRPGIEPAADRTGLRRAFGTCPKTDAAVDFVSHPTEGVLIGFHVDVVEPEDRRAAKLGVSPHAANAIAWLIHDEAGAIGSLARRLGRLGWTAVKFRSPRHAAARLLGRPGHAQMPALVIVNESSGYGLGEVLELRRRLAPWTRCIYAMAADSPVLARPESLPALELRVNPLSPAELDEMSAWLAADAEGPLSQAFPLPLNQLARPRMLVVDGDAVSRLIANCMAQCLGHEVETASDGLQAIDKCLRSPPSVILMDLDMPRMNGLEATRHIRSMQQSGALPPCRILATAPSDNVEVRRACRAAGMDGYLRKPLGFESLQAELRRVLADAERGD